MLEWGGVINDGCSNSVDSAMVNGLLRGQWSPDDLLSSLHNSLQTFAVPYSSAAIPRSDAVGQDVLNYTAVEVVEDLR